MTVVLILSGQEFKTSGLFFPEKQTTPADFFHEHKRILNIHDGSTFALEKNGFSKFSKSHLKYRQFHNGLPVFGHSVTLHLQAGKVNHVTGRVASFFDETKVKGFEKEEIISLLLPFFQTDEEGVFTEIRDVEISHFEKVFVDPAFPGKSNKFIQAFDVHLISQSTGKHIQYLVEAKNGGILFSQNLVCSFLPKGSAPSYHYGTVELETEQAEANKYVLRDVTRGKGNSTFVNTLQGDILLSDDDNVWEKPTHIAKLGHVAFDAHYCTMKFYDFLDQRFQYSGIDGNGRSMIARVNINNGADLVNAFWNNQNAAFGNGNCHYHPLTTLSIVGHEFAHGITSDNSKLIYSGESGAINESFSDIIGKAFELVENPTGFQWPIGHEIVATRFAKPFRSMEDPTIYGNPKMYKGKNWRDGGGVHSNSGVLNHWFYLLVNGGIGRNEVDTAYNVLPVAVQDILDIIFLCQTSYLEPASGYPEMFEFSKIACKSLFGENSSQYKSLLEAWKAVGLPYEGMPIENYDDIVLTAKIKNDPNNSFTCYQGAYPEINVFLANKGTLFYPAGTVFKVNFTRNGQTVEKNLVLPVDLAPDSTRVVAVPDYVYIDKTEYFSVEMNLLHNDHVQSNNRFFLYFQNYNTTGVDLQISGVSHQEMNCFSNEITFFTRVKNNSCFTAPQGNMIQLEVKNLDTDEVLTFSHTNNLAQGPRQETQITAKLPYDWISLNYTYSIFSAIDSITTNNQSQYTVIEKGIIDGIKKYTFDNDAFDQDFKHNSPQSKFAFEDDYYFRTKTNFSSSNSPCLEEADNFKNINGGVSQFTVAETCLDVTGLQKPMLRFDMRQFRSSFFSTFPELEGNSTIFKIEFSSADIKYFPDPVKNEETGVSVPYLLEIPSGFKGSLRLVAFTSRHDGTSAINDKNDVILLDNFEIFDVVKTNDDDLKTDIFISPNPSEDYTMISGFGQRMKKVRMMDISGKPLAEYVFGQGVSEMHLPMSHLPGGSYLVEITTHEKVYMAKIIKR